MPGGYHKLFTLRADINMNPFPKVGLIKFYLHYSYGCNIKFQCTSLVSITTIKTEL